MDAEQNQEVPEAVAETQEVAMQQEEKLEPKSEGVVEPPSEPEPEQKAPEMEMQQELPEKEKITESEATPSNPSEPKVALEKPTSLEKSPENTLAAEVEKLPEKSPEAVPVLEQQKEANEEPKVPVSVQLNSEPEKQEEEAVKEAEPKKADESGKEAEPKPTAVNEAKDGEAKTEEAEKTQASEAEGVSAELPKEEATQPKEPELPLFFGWFLLPEEVERVKSSTMEFLKSLGTLEAFKNHISDFTGEAEKEFDLEQYFQTSQTLHCTTKFCDYGKAEGAKEYAELQVVKDSFGNPYELSVIALLVTPRTFGARVALTETQMSLWPEGADKDKVPPAILPSVEGLPTGSRAHVTLACAAEVENVQTGLDLLEILCLQKEGKEEPQEGMEQGTLSYLGEGRWYLALKEPIAADTTFSSFSEDKPSNEQTKKDGEKKKKKCTIL